MYLVHRKLDVQFEDDKWVFQTRSETLQKKIEEEEATAGSM